MERAQSTVELAVLLPVILLLFLALLQAGLVVLDRLAVVNSARVGARVAAVSPSVESVRSAASEQGIDLERSTVRLSGSLRPGQIATIEVSRPMTLVPIIGHLIGARDLREQIAFRVEGVPE